MRPAQGRENEYEGLANAVPTFRRTLQQLTRSLNHDHWLIRISKSRSRSMILSNVRRFYFEHARTDHRYVITLQHRAFDIIRNEIERISTACM
jgi:hypothetical protein